MPTFIHTHTYAKTHITKPIHTHTHTHTQYKTYTKSHPHITKPTYTHPNIHQTQKMKYLGIHLDNKYNFNAHIDQTVAKLISLVNMLCRTAKLQWGSGHKALKTIYEGA